MAQYKDFIHGELKPERLSKTIIPMKDQTRWSGKMHGESLPLRRERPSFIVDLLVKEALGHERRGEYKEAHDAWETAAKHARKDGCSTLAAEYDSNAHSARLEDMRSRHFSLIKRKEPFINITEITIKNSIGPML